MKTKEKNEIYDRLLEIKMEIQPDPIPNPGYINQKLGQCHVFIEEVEKFFIRVSKEVSLEQRLLNDLMAQYETEKEDLIANDPDIKSLPSIKDREAQANSCLKQIRSEVRQHENELSDLNNLLKAINLKHRNLGRINSDIRTQLRLMESQMKMGGSMSDSVSRDLAEELNKGLSGKDSFEDVETSVEKSTPIDPSEPLDINNLLTTDVDGSEDEEAISEDEETISEDLIDPVPQEPDEDNTVDPTDIDGINPQSEDAIKESGRLSEGIDLDALIDDSKPSVQINPEPSTKPENQVVEGGEQTQKGNETASNKSVKNVEAKKSDGIDIENLLSQFN